MEALDAEVAGYVERHRAERGTDSRALVVRNGRGRPRQVTTGAGTLEVQVRRVHDRRLGHGFTSSILPPYMRRMHRSPKVSEVHSVLYLRGLATGDFKEALDAMQEALANAVATGAPPHIVHLNSMALGEIDTVLGLIGGARRLGLDVTTEAYPYTAGSTSLHSSIFDEGWQGRLSIDYGDLQWEATGERLTRETFERYRRERGTVSADRATSYEAPRGSMRVLPES